MDSIRIVIEGDHKWGDRYVADISTVSAIVSSSRGDIGELPDLMMAPGLYRVLETIALDDSPSEESRAIDVLFAGSGHQKRKRHEWSVNKMRVKELLGHVSVSGSHFESDEASHLDYAVAPSVDEEVGLIREETVALAKEHGAPVIAIGDGFKRSIRDMPALVYSKGVRGLESIRSRIRGATDSDKRCMWFVFFAQVAGACLETHMNLDGLPTHDLAMMMDP